MVGGIVVLIVEPDDQKYENVKNLVMHNKNMHEYMIKRAKTVKEALGILFSDAQRVHENYDVDIVMAPQDIPKESTDEYYRHNFGVLTIMRNIMDSGAETLTVVLDYVESIKMPTSACRNVIDSCIYNAYLKKAKKGDVWNG